MPPVTRKMERVQDGTSGGTQKWTGMSMNCPVSICKCGRVLSKNVKSCPKCREKH